MTTEPTSVFKGENVMRAVVFENGMLMVFDKLGQQMPEFQGRAEEMVPVLRAAGYTGKIEMGIWR